MRRWWRWPVFGVVRRFAVARALARIHGVRVTREKRPAPGQALIATVVRWKRGSLDVVVRLHEGCSTVSLEGLCPRVAPFALALRGGQLAFLDGTADAAQQKDGEALRSSLEALNRAEGVSDVTLFVQPDGVTLYSRGELNLHQLEKLLALAEPVFDWAVANSLPASEGTRA